MGGPWRAALACGNSFCEGGAGGPPQGTVVQRAVAFGVSLRRTPCRRSRRAWSSLACAAGRSSSSCRRAAGVVRFPRRCRARPQGCPVDKCQFGRSAWVPGRLAPRFDAGGRPIYRLHYDSGNLQGAGPVAAVFPKAPRDRPTFIATRRYCVPPRISRRAYVLRRYVRAWRMCRLGRNGSALRCVSAIRRPDVARRNHTQAGERRAREALVRAGAGFHDDRRTGEAGAAGR